MSKKSITLAFASDLHLLPWSSVYRTEFLDASVQPDILVLAGDLANGSLGIDIVQKIAETYVSTQIVYVLGNHEFYYGTTRQETLDLYRRTFSDHDRVHVLENDRIEIFGLTFLGCTLWSDFSLLGEPELAMSEAKRHIADFSQIHERVGDLFTPYDAERLFRESYEFLDQNLARCDPEKTIVVTHFPPSIETHNQNFAVGPLTAYFQANVIALIDCYQPELWIYGHNHYSADFYIGQTRVVSNQLGYVSEPEYITNYDRKAVIKFQVD
jgi:Icc-related predicted phosphoesterase